MAAEAIALIVAGSGEVTADEVADMLDDAYGDVEEVGLIVPVDKDLFTEAVENAVEWYNNDKDVYPVQTEGASLSRRSAKLGDEPPQKVEKFVDFLDPEEFKDWDEVHVLIAMPPESNEDEYDFYAEVADAALQAGFKALDLTQGLDDIVVTDAEVAEEEEPEPEPEPEPVKEEKPAPKRSRSRKKVEPEPDPVVAEEIEKIEEEKPVDQVHNEREILTARVKSLEERLEVVEDLLTRLGMVLTGTGTQFGEPKDEPTPAAEAEEPEPKEAKSSGRGRGRPRTNFEVKQVWDDEEEAWVPRPAGRMRKGTQWRTIHAETNEVLDEGTA